MFEPPDLQQLFASCRDVSVLALGDSLLIYDEGMCDVRLMYEVFIPALTKHGPDYFEQQSPSGIMMAVFGEAATEQEIVNAVFSGMLVVHNGRTGTLFAADFGKIPQRGPDDSNVETSNMGPRDAFTESLVTNMALVRKRLRTVSLHAEEYLLGSRTQTRVSLLYMKDILSQDILNEVRHRLERIEIDAIYSAQQLSALLAKPLLSLVPMHGMTTRPDLVVASLVAGRFVLLLDGLPVALTGPANLGYLLCAAEDLHTPKQYGAFISLIRLASILITMFLPGFWIALTTYHQDQIPFPLLATISVASDGTPFSEPLELFLVLLMFQLFIEAGNRLPSSIGSMLSVVGGLIIGDAAIRSGLSSPATLLVAAVSSTSAFVLMTNGLGLGVILIRLYVLLFSSFIGMFGFLVAVFSIILYAASLRSYGVPFLAPFSPLRLSDLLFNLSITPWKKRKQRPAYLQTQDKVGQKNGGEA